MDASFRVSSAEELLDTEFIAKWQDRKVIDPLARRVLEAVLKRFVADGGPIPAEALESDFPAHEPMEVSAAVARLDEKDLILARDGQVLLAYPFAGMPTAFSVRLPSGQERYAVCAIDALGVPALLGEPVVIRSRCHHCGEPLAIHVRPDGPKGSAAVMVWVGERGDLRDKAFSSL